MRLFAASATDGKRQGQRIVEESARFNLTPAGIRFNRTLNVPMTALRYLQRQNQSRSVFEAGRLETRNGRPAVRLRFKELSTMAPLVGSNQGARAEGAFWIEPGSGRVIATELSFAGASVKASIKVDFAEQAATRLWLPSVMEEAYQLRLSQVIVTGGRSQQVVEWVTVGGRATYTNYRQFTVSTDVKSDEF